MNKVLLIFIFSFLVLGKVFSQCPVAFPATTAELDCDDASVTPLTNNANISAGQDFGFCGTDEDIRNFSGVNLSGGTIRVCGNATLSGNFNSGKIIVQCGATLTFNSGLFLNQSIQIINYGTVDVKGDFVMQNPNSVFYNEGPDSRLIVSGGVTVPQNVGQDVYWKNEGFMEIGGTLNAREGMNFCMSDGSITMCRNFNYMSQCNNTDNRFSYADATGSAILRYQSTATLFADVTASSNINVRQATGGSVNSRCSGTGSFGSATFTTNAASIARPDLSFGSCLANCFTTGVLPIQLEKFNVISEGSSNRIEWSTYTELNNQYFMIERSIDTENWEEIGMVMGAGNSYENVLYSYEDNYSFRGVLYYRLTQVDYDGSKEIFDIAVVESEGDISEFSFNNPVEDLLILRNRSNDLTAYFIMNTHGEKVLESDLISNTINVEDLLSGVYLFKGNDGTRFRFVKN